VTAEGSCLYSNPPLPSPTLSASQPRYTRRRSFRADESGEEEAEAPQNAEQGNQQDSTKREEVAGYGESSGTAQQAAAKSEQERGSQGSSDKGIPYPEWDYRESRYKRNWAWVL
jgi:hypothetical protein